MLDKDFDRSAPRDEQLTQKFNILPIDPICTDEYIKIPIDLPWNELAKDVPLAFEKFGWYGMVHRMRSDWTRSELYGGLGLTYNPDYIFDVEPHAQGLGQPRAAQTNTDPATWLKSLKKYDYGDYAAADSISGLNTYNDPLGLRVPTDVTKFRSFPSFFDQLKRPIFQGRFAELRAKEHGHKLNDNNKELAWHIDEKNEIVSRLLVPICYSEDYYIEFQESGTKLYFEPGYAYHWNTYKVHRWAFDYHKAIENRTCLILGWSPWLDFDGTTWSTNEYFGKVHPMDMIKAGLLI